MIVNKLPKILIRPMATVELDIHPPIAIAEILQTISIVDNIIAVPCRDATKGKLDNGEATKFKNNHGNRI
jgi:hypothetical protein